MNKGYRPTAFTVLLYNGQFKLAVLSSYFKCDDFELNLNF